MLKGLINNKSFTTEPATQQNSYRPILLTNLLKLLSKQMKLWVIVRQIFLFPNNILYLC